MHGGGLALKVGLSQVNDLRKEAETVNGKPPRKLVNWPKVRTQVRGKSRDLFGEFAVLGYDSKNQGSVQADP